MAFSIDEIRGALLGGGARPTLFSVQITNKFSALAGADDKLTFTCKAANLPPSQLGHVEIPYFGRKVKFSGDRTYPDWTITVINDEDFLVRRGMEDWMAAINDPETNLRTITASGNLYKQTQAAITQYGRNGVPIRIYQFNGIFPTAISPIGTDWGDTDKLEEFSVTFQYDYWTPAL